MMNGKPKQALGAKQLTLKVLKLLFYTFLTFVFPGSMVSTGLEQVVKKELGKLIQAAIWTASGSDK